ncbi:hypothetical protein ACTWPT_47250 [Nonomuraea sp. 3N208]|jgi:hypothetical protein|uniref:hypothetical protein n=1 Tax=Nonomuraea sp. 3N208 TaxID=3457421 RepID=UPI003FCFE644
MIKTLHKMGVRSNHMYFAGLCSIGLACTSWMVARSTEHAGLDRADRWGIFVGEWAPTFFAIGVALRMEETHRDIKEPGMETYEETQRIRPRTHAGV